MLFKDFSLGVVPNDLVVDEAGEIKHLRAELRHGGGVWEDDGRQGREEMLLVVDCTFKIRSPY